MKKCLCISKVPNFGVNFYDFFVGDWYNYTTKTFTSREYPEGYNVEISKGEYIFFRKFKDTSGSNYGLFSKHFKKTEELRKEKIKHLDKR